MNKLLIAFAAALFAIPTLLGSPAEAGGRGGFRVFQNPAFHMIREYHNDDYTPRRHRKARRHVKRKTHTAKRRAPKTVAKAEEPKAKAPSKAVESENSSIATAGSKVAEVKTDKPAQVGESENSSIATADGAKVAEAKTDKPEQVAEVRDVGCKKFFPAAGVTLSVPCE